MIERRSSRMRKQTRNKTVVFTILFSLCIVIFTALAGIWTYDYVQQLKPSDKYVPDVKEGLDKPVVINGEVQQISAIGTGASLKIALPAIQEFIDPNIYYEEQSDSIVITTANKHVYFRTDQLTAMMNEEPISLQFPVEKANDTIYLPIQPLIDLYGIDIRESAETGFVTILKEKEVLQWGKVLPYSQQQTNVKLRKEPKLKSLITADLEAGEKVIILREKDGWFYVQKENGILGYVLKSRVALTEVEQIPEVNTNSPFVPWKPLGGKINLTWEAVYNVPPKPENIGEMPGVNVISPTWFDLKKSDDGEFFVYNNHADANYVNWAHNRGYQVWALFSNSFDPDLTKEMLATYETRLQVIRQLLYYAELYDLQGINLDFENVYIEERDLLTQFVRELTPLLHEQGLVVSMDVTIRGGSEMWSLFYDREALGQIVDYMIVMTYDEHYAASPVAGSVASLPWVEKGMTDIMQHDGVPASKLILGAPTYTRIWTERVEDGNVKVSSRAVSMSAVQNIIESRSLVPTYLEEVGQNYVEYVNDEGHVEKIWIEDAASMRARAELVNKYEFAGIATWRRGFETPDIWNVIEQTLNKRLHK